MFVFHRLISCETLHAKAHIAFCVFCPANAGTIFHNAPPSFFCVCYLYPMRVTIIARITGSCPSIAGPLGLDPYCSKFAASHAMINCLISQIISRIQIVQFTRFRIITSDYKNSYESFKFSLSYFVVCIFF